MRSVSRAFRSSRSGLGRPRSANTLPLLASARIFFFLCMSVLPFCVMPLRLGETRPDKIDVMFRRGSAFLGLLLKDMEDVNRILEVSGIDGAICIRFEPFNNLHDLGTTESLK